MNVHEAGRPGDPNPTPRELNAQLYALYENLPLSRREVDTVGFEAGFQLWK